MSDILEPRAPIVKLFESTAHVDREKYAYAHPEEERDLDSMTGRLALLQWYARQQLPSRGKTSASAIIEWLIQQFMREPTGEYLLNRERGFIEIGINGIADHCYRGARELRRVLPIVKTCPSIRIEPGIGGSRAKSRATRWHVIDPTPEEVAEMVKARAAVREAIRKQRRESKRRWAKLKKLREARLAEEARILAEICS